jgi:hypothetical protein
MNTNDAEKLSLDLLKAALASGWLRDMPIGQNVGQQIAAAHDALASGIVATSQKLNR